MPRIRIALLALPVALVALAASAPGALALSPWWHVSIGTRPSSIKPGVEGEVLVQALNVGDGPTSEPITVTDTLPEGVTVEQVEPEAGKPEPKVSFKPNA